MPIGMADLHAAFSTFWDEHDLDWNFKKYWPESDRDQFIPVYEGEAEQDQPWPYCVWTMENPTIASRMSGGSKTNDHHTAYPFEIQIYAKRTSTQDAKAIASELAEIIMSKMGGHPTIPPEDFTLTNGSVVQVQFLRDYGMKMGDDEYAWTIQYSFLVDSPIRMLK